MTPPQPPPRRNWARGRLGALLLLVLAAAAACVMDQVNQQAHAAPSSVHGSYAPAEGGGRP